MFGTFCVCELPLLLKAWAEFVTISSGIQNTVWCKKIFNESILMGKLIRFYINMQSGMLNVCLHNHFTKKGHILFKWVGRCCLKWQGNFVYDKSMKIKAMLLIISLSFLVCFKEEKNCVWCKKSGIYAKSPSPRIYVWITVIRSGQNHLLNALNEMKLNEIFTVAAKLKVLVRTLCHTKSYQPV